MIEPESEEIASSPDLSPAGVGSPDDPSRRTQAWLKESVEDTFSDSENETDESLLSEDLEDIKSRSRKKKIKRDTKYVPTLKDLQLVGDILFTERPTVGYSANEQKELIALGDVTNLASEGRVSVFEKGIHFEKKGKPGLALQCYLACIQGLDGEVGNFPQLPQCLRHIARLYFAEEEYEKAVHFVQAEKLYYETAILSTRDKRTEDESDTSDEPLDLRSMMIARAQEFEQLADMCLHSKNVGLALDYIGKAAKINEAVYGKNDQRSRRSYEKFSYIYSEAGKLQYNDALKRFQRKQSQSTMKVLERQEQQAEEELFTPEQSLTQKVFSLALLLVFLIIIIIEVTLVILSFSKGYLYIPSGNEVLNFFRYFWLKIIGPQEL
ncbi:hypothetical protein ACHWQZ_G002563 [Mnemiopsis leidyi]